MSFTQLHIHTHWGSPLDGVSSTEDYAKIAKEKKHPAVAITDHGKMNGFFKHQQACLKEGIKPIFGVEAYVVFDELEKYEMKGNRQKRLRNENLHLILLAKNKQGYRNLLKLNYLSMSDDSHYYYRNHITIEEVFKNKEGLIVGSGCGNSPFNTLFRWGREKEAEELYSRFVEEFGDDFYTELQMSELMEEDYNQKLINDFELRMAKKFNRMIVLAGDVHYAEKGMDQVQTISIAVRNKDTIDNLSFEIESKNLYYHDIDDYKNFNKEWDYGYNDKQIEEWCNNTLKIAEKCNYLIPERQRMILPDATGNDDVEIIKKAKEGLSVRLGVSSFDECDEVYRNRLNEELSVITRKGMSNYILILQDVFIFADKEKIMKGVGRGSAAGSLVLYCMGITTIDPIKYGLIFERFLSAERSPDVVYDWFGDIK